MPCHPSLLWDAFSAVLFYRVLISLFAAVVLAKSGGQAERRARLARDLPDLGPVVWLHGASNGELASVRALLTRLIEARPDLQWRITANTTTGVAMARGWDLPRTHVALAPVDLARVSARAMKAGPVVAHVALESELWPHRFRLCPGPVILLGARMSEKTARGWSKVPGLARQVFGTVSFATAQDAGSLSRLGDLGLPASAQGPVVDLKALYTPPDLHPDAALRTAFPRDLTWLAASTHEGEDTIVLEAHVKALQDAPDLKLILAPRHPRRADAIETMIVAKGLTCSRRSRGDAADTQVYLADTMGEMPLWYALAGRVFVAGSLTDRGGHTPYEPAQFGAAILHGPDVRNFKAAYGRLTEADAARSVADADALADALTALASAEAQDTLGTAAQHALTQETDLDALISHVLDALPQRQT